MTLTAAERAALIDTYKAGHAAVLSALEGITAAELDATLLAGEWSVRQIAHHLADGEMHSAIRLRRLIAEDRPLIMSYDEPEYARRLYYDDRPIEPSLAVMGAARASTADILDHLTEAEWLRTGTHSESGPYDVETWLRLYASHGHDHADQIRKTRAAATRST